jgi:hypothetical protein
VRIKEEAALAGKSPLPRGISATPTPLRASRFPRCVTLRRAVVLGALALSQDQERPRPRSHPRPSRAATAGGFRGSADRDKRRRAHRARQKLACGLGLRQLRPGRADRAGGVNLEDAQPPRRSHLLVGAIAALKGMRALALTVMGHLDMVRPSICAAWFCRADGDLLMPRSYFVASHVCASNAREPAVKPTRYGRPETPLSPPHA